MMDAWFSFATAIATDAPLSVVSQESPAEAPSAGSANDDEITDTIVVTGTRRSVPVDRRSYDIEVGPDAATVTAQEAIERLPGVIMDVEGQMSVIGQPLRAVLVDGEFFPRELALQIPASQIDRIEIVTNPGAETQGDGVTINIVLKTATQTSRNLTVSMRADTRERYEARATYDAEGPKWSQATTLSLEDELTLVDTSVDLAFLTEEQAGQTGERRVARARDEREADFLSVTRRKLPGGRRVSLIASATVSERITGNDRRFTRRDGEAVIVDRTEASVDSSDVVSLALGGGYNHDRSDDDKFVFTVNGSFFDGKYGQFDTVVTDGAARVFDRQVHIAQDSLFVNASRRINRGGGRRLEIGLFGQVSDSRRRIGGTDTAYANGLIPPGRYDFSLGEVAVFGSYAFRLGDLNLKPGLRAEAFGLDVTADGQDAEGEPTYARLLPSLHLGYDVGRLGQLKASAVAKTVTSPTNAFDPVLRQTRFDSFERGDATLNVGRGVNFEVSHEVERGKVTLLTTGYHRRREDTVEPFLDFLGEDLFVFRYVNLDDDRETGVNLNVTHKIGARWEQVLDVNVFSAGQRWDVDGRDFARDIDSYDAKYNLEYRHSDKQSALLIVQQEGPGLDLNARDEARLSSTIRYVRRFGQGWVLTMEGIDLLSTNEQTIVFESDTLRSVTSTEFQERGFRVKLSKRF